MISEGIKFEIKDQVGILTLSRPERLNAITVLAHYHYLPKLLAEIQADEKVRVLIITGEGRGFCAGAELSQNWSDLSSFDMRNDERLQPFGGYALSIYNLEKPVIAAVNGVAAGAGVSIALVSDIRFASENAKFALSFVRRGLVPDCGATFLMPRLIGIAKALELMYTGDTIDAKEAERIGLVDKVVPHEALMNETITFANRLVDGPPLAMAQIKRAVHLGLTTNLEQQIYFETYAQNFCRGTKDYKEGVDAFFEKRSPKFTGI